MDITALLIWLALGAVAGFIAGQIMKGRGFGVLGNIIVGILGSFLGGFIFNQLGMSAGGGMIGSIITAVIGAVVLLFIASLVRRNT